MSKNLNIEGRQVPQPSYEYEVRRLVRLYKNALRDIQGELKRTDVTNMRRAQNAALLASIRKRLLELDKDALAWVEKNVPLAAANGVAASLVSLGLAETIEEAQKIANFNKANKKLAESAAAYTSNSVLAITSNMHDSVKQGIKDIAELAVRNNLTQGYGMRTLRNDMIEQIKKLQDELVSTADVAIRDKAGRKWKVEHYAETLARTTLLNVHTEATTKDALGRGAQYAIVSTNPKTKDACRWHEGRIIKLDPNAEGNFMTYDELKASAQIFHPNCKHHIMPFRRFDRLSEEAINTAAKKETVGRSAMQAGGRTPTKHDVLAGRRDHAGAFTIPEQKNLQKPIKKEAKQVREEARKEAQKFDPNKTQAHKELVENLYKGRPLSELAEEYKDAKGRIRLDPTATRYTFGDKITLEGLEYAFNPDPSKYTVSIRGLKVQGSDTTAETALKLRLLDKNGETAARIERTIVKHEGRYYVKNDLMEFSKSLQGDGSATSIYFKTEQLYREIANGAPINISLLANLDVGVYAWTRLGFDFKDADEALSRQWKVQEAIEKKITERMKAGEFGTPNVDLTKEKWYVLKEQLMREAINKMGYNNLDEIKHAWQFGALDDGNEYDIWTNKTKGHLGKHIMINSQSWDGVKKLNQGHDSELISNLYFESKGVK